MIPVRCYTCSKVIATRYIKDVLDTAANATEQIYIAKVFNEDLNSLQLLPCCKTVLTTEYVQ